MRQLALVLSVVLGGCCCDLKKESYADVPLTLSDAKTRAEKMGATITVTRQTARPSGGGACGHSAACVIILPLLLVDRLFPEKWDEVVIKKGDEVEFYGSFDTSGDLRHANHLKDGTVYETRAIELKSLGKKAYVDSARLEKKPGSDELVRVPLPLSTQHDFIAEERALLTTLTDPQKRADAITEAVFELEGEGLAFAKEMIAAPTEKDETRGALMRAVCAHPSETQEIRATLLEHEGPWVALGAVACTSFDTDEYTAALNHFLAVSCNPSAPVAVLKAFDDRSYLRELTRTGGDSEGRLASANKAIEACPAGPHRALINLWLGNPVEAAELTAFIAAPDVALGAKYLRADQAPQRAAMVSLITSDHDAAPQLILKLSENEQPLEPELGEALVKRFITRTGIFEGGDRTETLRILERMGSAPDAATRTKSSRALLAAAAKSEKKAATKGMLEAMQVLLGDASRLPAASAVVVNTEKTDFASLDDSVITWCLFHSGCTQEQINAAAKGKPITSCSRTPAQ